MAQRQRGELREMWWIEQEQAEQPRSNKPEPATGHPRQLLHAASLSAEPTQQPEPRDERNQQRVDGGLTLAAAAPSVPSLDALMSREIQAAEERLRRQFNVPREPVMPARYAPVQR